MAIGNPTSAVMLSLYFVTRLEASPFMAAMALSVVRDSFFRFSTSLTAF